LAAFARVDTLAQGPFRDCRPPRPAPAFSPNMRSIGVQWPGRLGATRRRDQRAGAVVANAMRSRHRYFRSHIDDACPRFNARSAVTCATSAPPVVVQVSTDGATFSWGRGRVKGWAGRVYACNN
jgi:hypothetical protein